MRARSSLSNTSLIAFYSPSLDIALWDIKGKTLGVPVWELLGGKVRDACNVYGAPPPADLPSHSNVYHGYLGWIGGDRPSDVLEQAKARKAQGFTAVKMNAVESVSLVSFCGANAPVLIRIVPAGVARLPTCPRGDRPASRRGQVDRHRRRTRLPRPCPQDPREAACPCS